MTPLQRPGKLRMSGLLMILAIIGIAVFQGYWFKKLYNEEWTELKKETDITFRDVLYKLQLQRFQKDTTFSKHGTGNNLFMFNVLDSFKNKLSTMAAAASSHPDMRHMTISITTNVHRDSSGKDSPGSYFAGRDSSIRDSIQRSPGGKKMMAIQSYQDYQTAPPSSPDGPLPFILKYFADGGDTASLPLSIGQIDSTYKKELLKSRIDVPYIIQRLQGTEQDLEKPVPVNELKTSFLFVGLSKTYAYQAIFGSPSQYILNRLKLPLLMGVLLLAFTTAAFIFLYRNLREQQQLAAIKNEFISNMTHELKTPISTVKVAVEALRHFGALDDPKKTREYLDISALELQRLSMLVDKVLKLSLFENKEIELNPALVDMKELAAEVITSMKLQLDKSGAFMQLTSSGERFVVKADRTHMSSVLSNLLDNALKYSREAPAITIHLSADIDTVIVIVSDNGIGIPAPYIGRIFEKFFRVPSGDHHNIKGYGLGLSYVHHIVQKHNGRITVESKEGKGTVFTIKLPAA